MTAFADFLLQLGPGARARRQRCGDQQRRTIEGDGWRLDLDEGPGAPPIVEATAGRSRLWLIGEADRPDGRGRVTSSELRPILDDILARREQPADLAGHWLLLLIDPGHDRVSLWTNRLGTFHAYYSIGPVRAIGSWSHAVYGTTQRQLDWEGLAGFFAAGFFPADRTHYQDVRIARPSSRYDFDATGRLRHSEATWRWRHDPDERLTLPDAADQFRTVFDGVMHRDLRQGRLAVPISGGLDSRCTVASLTDADDYPAGGLWSYSYGYEHQSHELAIARQVARRRRLPFQEFVVPEYLLDGLDRVIDATEGFVDVTQSRQAGVIDQVAGHADRLVAAHWGDVWHSDMGLAGQRHVDPGSLLDHALGKILKTGRAWALEHIVRPKLGEPPEACVRAQVAAELSRVAHLEDPDFQVKAFKTEQWSFRWTMPSVRSFMLGLAPRLPFYDPSIVDFFARVPTRLVAGRMLQVEYLRRHAPDLAAVPWQAYGADLFRYPAFNPNTLPRRAVRRLRRVLTGHQPRQRNWEVQFLSQRGRAALEARLMRPASGLHDLVSPAAIRQLLDHFYRRRGAGDGVAVCGLLSFSAWLEREARAS